MGGWGMPGGMQGGWGMPPPVPPPGWGGMQGAPQAQQQHPGYMTGGYMGVPPPPPPTSQGASSATGPTKPGSKIDLNALAQAGLPNLLAAPPPPPPPPQ
jgi:formin 2